MPVKINQTHVTLERPPFDKFCDKRNYVHFQFEPELTINIGAQAKRPGKRTGAMPVELTAVEKAADAFGDYERLLGDALEGDHLLFVRGDLVDLQWAIVDSILDDATPLCAYEPGSWGPREADRLVADLGGWGGEN